MEIATECFDLLLLTKSPGRPPKQLKLRRLLEKSGLFWTSGLQRSYDLVCQPPYRLKDSSRAVFLDLPGGRDEILHQPLRTERITVTHEEVSLFPSLAVSPKVASVRIMKANS